MDNSDIRLTNFPFATFSFPFRTEVDVKKKENKIRNFRLPNFVHGENAFHSSNLPDFLCVFRGYRGVYEW